MQIAQTTLATLGNQYFFAVGIEIWFLILTAYAGLILALLLFAYTLATRRGRERMMTVYPWIAGVLILLIVFPHLIWLNPIPEKQWAYTESIGMLQNLVNKRMYPLTLSGLEAGMRELVR